MCVAGQTAMSGDRGKGLCTPPVGDHDGTVSLVARQRHARARELGHSHLAGGHVACLFFVCACVFDSFVRVDETRARAPRIALD